MRILRGSKRQRQRQCKFQPAAEIAKEHLADKRNGCEPVYCWAVGKVRHPSRKSAKKHLRNLNRSGHAEGVVKAYWCGKCGGWHVGRVKTAIDRLLDRLVRCLENLR